MIAWPLTLTAAAPVAAAPPPQNDFVGLLITMALMFVVFYFLLIRPQQQARKKHAEMVANIKRGDTVVTAGGFVGKVTRAGDGDEINFQIADGVDATIVRSAVTDVRARSQPAKSKTENS